VLSPEIFLKAPVESSPVPIKVKSSPLAIVMPPINSKAAPLATVVLPVVLPSASSCAALNEPSAIAVVPS
jgi:hypothetical protein